MRRPPALAGTLALLLSALVVLPALVGCTDRKSDSTGGQKSPAGPLPVADELLTAAAAEMTTVKTAGFDVATEGAVDALGIKGADGVITREGDAKGTARLDQDGTSVVELSFVVKDGTLYVNGLTGGWQQLPLSLASSVYDPSAMLDPDRGVSKLLATARSGATQGRESVGGVDTYRVRATLDVAPLAALVPGITDNVTGTLWIGDDRRLLHKASFPVPGQGGTVSLTFTEFDTPVTISAP